MISIITVCHKSSDLLRPYVSSFLEHNRSHAGADRIEFVLVENSGDAETGGRAAELRQQGFAARVVEVENRGFGAGCNAGAELAQGQLLIFANPDIHFLSDVSALERDFVGSRWGTVLQRSGRRNADYAFDLLPEYRSLASELMRVYRYAHRIPPLYRRCYPVGSFMIVPKATFMDVGGFDERFFLYYEEAELSRRLQARFGPPVCSRAASILHEGFGTQSSMEFTLREEAKGLVTYGLVTDQINVVRKRVRILRRLNVLVPNAGQRATYLLEAMERAGIST